jgi:hypothetical protein
MLIKVRFNSILTTQTGWHRPGLYFFALPLFSEYGDLVALKSDECLVRYPAIAGTIVERGVFSPR